MKKICSICKQEKEIHNFYNRKDSIDGYEGNCKECRNTKRKNNPNYKENTTKASTKFEVKRKGKRWGYHLAKTYGLTEDLYYKILEEQGNACAICKLPIDKETHYGKFVVDHCHVTGKVRGLLCNKCNLMLGNARDDIRILNEGIKYLKESYDR